MLQKNQVVLDLKKNYVLTHFDIDLNKEQEFKDLVSNEEFLDNDVAPEFFRDKKYALKSNVWDLGILLYSILSNGKSAHIDYKEGKI